MLYSGRRGGSLPSAHNGRKEPASPIPPPVQHAHRDTSKMVEVALHNVSGLVESYEDEKDE